MNIDGSSLQQITTSLLIVHSAHWSPDGKRLVVRKGIATGGDIFTGGGCPELWIVDANAGTIDLTSDSDAAFRPLGYDDDGDLNGVCAFSPAYWRAS